MPTVETTADLRKQEKAGWVVEEKTRQLDNTWLVRWEWAWVPRINVGKPWTDIYMANRQARDDPQQQPIILSTPRVAPQANYKVDLTERIPHYDAEPREAAGDYIALGDPHSSEQTFIAYNAEGHASPPIKASVLKNLYQAAKENDKSISNNTFCTAVKALTQRYSPRRGAAHNKAEKKQFEQEWATPNKLRKQLAACLDIRHELFSHPLNRSPDILFNWSAHKRDKIFGAFTDAYSWNWHSTCYMKPGIFGKRTLQSNSTRY